MKKILVGMFLLVFGLCLVGCNLVESKTFTIALRDGLYSGQYNDIYDIYIEFDNISIMEFVKTQTGFSYILRPSFTLSTVIDFVLSEIIK